VQSLYRITIRQDYLDKINGIEGEKSKKLEKIGQSAGKLADGLLEIAEESSNKKIKKTATLLKELLRLFLD
jgi:hypothetical protein